MDDSLRRLLVRQHGYVTRAQAIEGAGLTRGQVDGMVRRGRLEIPAPGLLRTVGLPPTPEGEMMAAALRCGSDARLVGPRCLALLGIRGFDRHAPFGVLVAPHRNRSSRTGLRVFRDPVTDDGTVTVDGLPMPRPARLMVEVARFLDGADLRSAVDAGGWASRPSKEDLAAAAIALPSRYGPAARIRALVRSGVLRLDSEPERRLLAIIGQRFGRVDTQVWVTPRRCVDVLLRDHAVALEYDGADHRTEAGRRRDRRRDAQLRRAGVEPVHVMHEDLASPAGLLRRITGAVEERRDAAM